MYPKEKSFGSSPAVLADGEHWCLHGGVVWAMLGLLTWFVPLKFEIVCSCSRDKWLCGRDWRSPEEEVPNNTWEERQEKPRLSSPLI